MFKWLKVAWASVRAARKIRKDLDELAEEDARQSRRADAANESAEELRRLQEKSLGIKKPPAD